LASCACAGLVDLVRSTMPLAFLFDRRRTLRERPTS
jgi:hypothetical protein